LIEAGKADEKVNTETKIFGSLPSIDACSGHPLSCYAYGFAHLLVTLKFIKLI